MPSGPGGGDTVLAYIAVDVRALWTTYSMGRLKTEHEVRTYQPIRGVQPHDTKLVSTLPVAGLSSGRNPSEGGGGEIKQGTQYVFEQSTYARVQHICVA